MVDVTVVKSGFHLGQKMAVVKAASMVVKLVVHLDQKMVVMTAGLMVVMME
jgi:hypothetical protein